MRAQAQLEFIERKAAEVRGEWAEADHPRKVAALAKQLEKLELTIVETRAVLAQREDMELALWGGLWELPQAVMWERQTQQWEVALYARRMIEAQERGSPVNLSTLVRQMADSLGLTTPGLRCNRWKIVTTKAAAAPPPSTPARRSARQRLKVVEGGNSA